MFIIYSWVKYIRQYYISQDNRRLLICVQPARGRLSFPKTVTPINIPKRRLFFQCHYDRPPLTGGGRSVSPPLEPGQVPVTASTNRMRQKQHGVSCRQARPQKACDFFHWLALSLSLSHTGTRPLCCAEAQATWRGREQGLAACPSQGLRQQPASAMSAHPPLAFRRF